MEDTIISNISIQYSLVAYSASLDWCAGQCWLLAQGLEAHLLSTEARGPSLSDILDQKKTSGAKILINEPTVRHYKIVILKAPPCILLLRFAFFPCVVEKETRTVYPMLLQNG